MVKKVLEGSLRSIAGTLTIEELITDRDRFQQAVSEAARGDLEASGIHIDALTITSIRDTKGYIEQLGEKNLASVVRDARIAKAGASQEASVKENEAQRIIIAAERDREIARADAQRVTAQAQANAQELEAQRRAKELITTTIRPAEAEREAAIVRAEGARQAAILAAEAQAKQVELVGQAEGAAILARGQAEARAKELLADAYRKFDEAAVLLQTLPLVPPIVREAAAPLGNINNLTVVDPSGASKLTDTVPTVRRDDRGTLLLDRVRIPRVELDVAAPNALAGLFVDREHEPPPPSALPVVRLALADLRLVELPVVERDVAARHVVDAVRGLDVCDQKPVGHPIVDALEPVAGRVDPCPLRHLATVDGAEIELVELHREPRPRADRPGEELSRRHAVARDGDEHDAVALSFARRDHPREERAPEAASAVLLLDRDIAPADVRIVRVLEVAVGDGVAH